MKQYYPGKSRPLPPRDELMKKFAYDPETGFFTIRAAHKGQGTQREAGSRIGYLSKGYVMLPWGKSRTAEKRHLAAHRVAWYIHHGVDDVTKVVDHINECKHDNRIDNLQLLTIEENVKIGYKRRASRKWTIRRCGRGRRGFSKK